MAYDFQKLADVELLEEVPDGASAFVAVDGTVKRVPGSGLGGGGGIATAILRESSESSASTNEETRGVGGEVHKLPLTCDNYTYTQAREVLEAGNPFAMAVNMIKDDMPLCLSSLKVALSVDYINAWFINARGKLLSIYWNADGFFDGEPVKLK